MEREVCQNLTEKLSEKRASFLSALMRSASIAAAAEKAGCSERSAYRWLADPQFRKAYRLSKRQQVEQAAVSISAGLGGAVSTLLKICKSESAPASARVTAAKAIMDGGFRMLEHDELASRVEELEKALGVNGPALNGKAPP